MTAHAPRRAAPRPLLPPLLALALIAARPSPLPAQGPVEWRAGVASVKITPDGPIRMAGYASRTKPSEGVAADLFAKALAIEDPLGTRLIIVTLDLIGVPRALRDWLERQGKERWELDPASILINASHTHCGPELRMARLTQNSDPGDAKAPDEFAANERYCVQLREKLLTAIDGAIAHLAPARLDYLHARAGFAMNRRRPTAHGPINAPHPDGPVDHDVPVLRVSDPASDRPIAALFGYACHNTTMGDLQIRGDYAGYAQADLQRAHPGMTALFLTGCAADQNPYPRRQEDMAKAHGRALALAVEASFESVPLPLRGPLRVAFEDVPLEFAPPPARAELEALAANAPDPHRSHARRLLRQLDDKGELQRALPCPVQVARFGTGLTLVAIGGEVVVDYSLRLKRELAPTPTWVAGYSNDVFGYLPSARILREGGYEAGGANVYGSLPGPFAPSVEESVISKALAFARAPIDSFPATVDLASGEEAQVKLCDGRTARVRLLGVEERRDKIRGALRGATVRVHVAGRDVTLESAGYHLPVTVGDVQIDCAVTRGFLAGDDRWGLRGDARLRLWPAGHPWITPATFRSPVEERWLSSGSLMANEVADGESLDKKSVYYHWGLDFGGVEGEVAALAASDGEVVSVAGAPAGTPSDLPSLVRPREDVVYLRDARGWYQRYSHLDSIAPEIRIGARVRMGQRIGVLGKRGASGGWAHLHFDIVAPQPGGAWGMLEPYALVFQAHHDAHPEIALEAVARPHQLAAVDQPVTLDGTRSWSRRGPSHLARFDWTFGDGKRAAGARVERRYAAPGVYSEILKVTDRDGQIDYDFAVVNVVDPARPAERPPRIHAAFHPTLDPRAGQPITFKARTFLVAPDEGEEEWDFGDGTAKVRTRSDGGADPHAPGGYAKLTHRYLLPGQYIVRVTRANRRGEMATAHLHVPVNPR